MKVLIATSTFARFPGDPLAAHGNAMYDLIGELGRSIEGTLITHAADGAPVTERLGGIEVRRIGPQRPRASLANAIMSREAPRVARVARSMRAHVRELANDHDVAHSFWFFPGGWSMFDLDMPKVMTVPGGIDTYPDRFFVGPRIRRIVRAMDVCVGVDTIGTGILERLGARTATYVPSPLKLDRFPLAPEVVEPRLVFVGRLGKEKGLDVGLTALAMALQERPDMTLEVIGDGPERVTLEGLARSLGIADSVRFRGSLDQTEVAAALQRARLLILPSRREGLPSAALEALATGRPVVASAVGGLPGLLEGGRGLTVPPEDAPALSAAMKQAHDTNWDTRLLRETALGFSIEKAAEAYIGIYRHLACDRLVGAR